MSSKVSRCPDSPRSLDSSLDSRAFSPVSSPIVDKDSRKSRRDCASTPGARQYVPLGTDLKDAARDVTDFVFTRLVRSRSQEMKRSQTLIARRMQAKSDFSPIDKPQDTSQRPESSGSSTSVLVEDNTASLGPTDSQDSTSTRVQGFVGQASSKFWKPELDDLADDKQL